MTSILHRLKQWLLVVWPAFAVIAFGCFIGYITYDNLRLDKALEAKEEEIAILQTDTLLAKNEAKEFYEDLLQASFDRDMNQEALDNATTRGMFFADQGNELMSILRKHEASLVDYLNFVSDNARYINPVQAYEAEKEFSKARDKLKKDIEKWQDAFVEFEQEHALGV